MSDDYALTEDSRIELNVGGKKYITTFGLLCKCKDSYLCAIVLDRSQYIYPCPTSIASCEIFIDRN
ncbi:conserved protein, unknown function, partial [Hepatocystis sp. ex Piliocolobus tephrosceles]